MSSPESGFGYDKVDAVGLGDQWLPIESDEYVEMRVDSSAFAERLNALFVEARTNGVAMTNAKLSKALMARGVRCSQPYLSQLRNGHKNRPSVALCNAIARIFGVPDDYFYLRSEKMSRTDSGSCDLAFDTLLVRRLSNPILPALLRNAALLPLPTQRLLSDLAARIADDEVRSAYRQGEAG